MGHRRRIVGLSGSVTRPSRTTALVEALTEAVAQRGDAEVDLIELADVAPVLFRALGPHQLGDEAAAIIARVENADLLVVGTPVYRASMTGALKHLFDLVDHRAFAGKPVLLAATGGSLMHALVTEHQMRPLFGFLNALTLPTTVYAVETDFSDYRLRSAKVLERVERAAVEAAGQLRVVPARLPSDRRVPA